MLAEGVVERITVVVPTEHLKTQWAQAAAGVGLSLDPKFSNSSAQNSDGVPRRRRHLCAGGQAPRPSPGAYANSSYAGGVRRDSPRRRREDVGRRDPGGVRRRDPTTRFDRYTVSQRRQPDPVHHLSARSGTACRVHQADHTYGYSDALADGVVRPVVFLAYSGEARWRDSAGEEHAGRLGEPLTAEHTARAWRTALDPAGEWMPAVIAAADTRLAQMRQHVPDAGGMVIASDQTAARAYAGLLAKITGETPTVVLSDDTGRPGASASSRPDQPVAGRGADGVRGCRRPPAGGGRLRHQRSTPLFFAQAIGRFVRSRRPGETASVFASVPNLLRLASEMEAERNHVLGKPQGSPRATRSTSGDASPSPASWTTVRLLGADAELDQVIFDGSSFGTATPAGSDEEADYLGIPGLLDADQMRDLLRRRQEEQLHEADRDRRGAPVVTTASCANCVVSSTRSCRSPITGRASRTAGYTKNCAGCAAAHRSRRRTPISSTPASKPSAYCRLSCRQYSETWSARHRKRSSS